MMKQQRMNTHLCNSMTVCFTAARISHQLLDAPVIRTSCTQSVTPTILYIKVCLQAFGSTTTYLNLFYKAICYSRGS